MFVQAVRTACEAAEQHPDALVTFGIRPTWPHTGLGYIHCSQTVADGVRQVVGFKEKPDRHTARRYVESGEHYWNSGMFVWKVATIRAGPGTQYLPELDGQARPRRRRPRPRAGTMAPILREVYPQLEKISIDFAVMEKAPKVLMVELKCEWLDVGSWPAVENIVDMDEAGNAVVAQNTAVLDSFRNVIVTEDDHLLAVVGIDDCIIVHSPDATLVCNKADSQRLKELVELIRQKYGRNTSRDCESRIADSDSRLGLIPAVQSAIRHLESTCLLAGHRSRDQAHRRGRRRHGQPASPRPWRSFPPAPQDQAIERIGELARQYRAEGIVVGLPLNMDGSEGPQAAAARQMAEQIAAALHLPVRLFDERLSSFAADQALAGKLTRAKKKARQDAVAAATMLGDFLAANDAPSVPRPGEE